MTFSQLTNWLLYGSTILNAAAGWAFIDWSNKQLTKIQSDYTASTKRLVEARMLYAHVQTRTVNYFLAKPEKPFRITRSSESNANLLKALTMNQLEINSLRQQLRTKQDIIHVSDTRSRRDSVVYITQMQANQPPAVPQQSLVELLHQTCVELGKRNVQHTSLSNTRWYYQMMVVRQEFEPWYMRQGQRLVKP